MQLFDLTKNFPYKMNFTDLPYGDKSITHRALICASLSNGKCVIKNPAINCDTLATIDCLQKLGAKITFLDGNSVEVIPFATPNDNIVFDCKNSGTTARLLAGVVAGLNLHVTFVGDKSLSSRPMKRIIDPLTQMGAKITDDIPSKKDYGDNQFFLFEVLPSTKLNAITYDTPVASAQVKSAVLFAGLFANGQTKVNEPIPTRNHTEIMLEQFGVQIDYGDCNAQILPTYPLNATDIDIPNDFSTCAFLLASKINDSITLKNVGLNPTRTAFLRWLSEFGANIDVIDKTIISGEARGTIRLSKGDFKPVNADYTLCSQMIDEIPICCVLACLAKGNSQFDGISELTHKESNRLLAINELLTNLGAKTSFTPNSITVYGKGTLATNQTIIAPNTNDHRIAMLGVVVGLINQLYVAPMSPKCIAVSTPNFFQLIGFPFEFGLFGSDTKNSLSPKIYKAITQVSGIQTNYQLFDTSINQFETDFFDKINMLKGANLTMPFKCVLTDQDTPINTVLNVGGNLLYFNTDGYGVLMALEQQGITLKDKIFLILGCGGSAKQAVKTLTQRGAKVVVRNRTQNKVKDLSKIYPIQSDYMGKFDGVLSFLPNVPELNLVTKKEIQDADFVFDACYTHKTIISDLAQKLNKKIIEGESMLFWQGVKNFEIWTGKKLTTKEVLLSKDIFYREIHG